MYHFSWLSIPPQKNCQYHLAKSEHLSLKHPKFFEHLPTWKNKTPLFRSAALFVFPFCNSCRLKTTQPNVSTNGLDIQRPDTHLRELSADKKWSSSQIISVEGPFVPGSSGARRRFWLDRSWGDKWDFKLLDGILRANMMAQLKKWQLHPLKEGKNEFIFESKHPSFF